MNVGLVLSRPDQCLAWRGGDPLDRHA